MNFRRQRIVMSSQKMRPYIVPGRYKVELFTVGMTEFLCLYLFTSMGEAIWNIECSHSSNS